MAVGTETTSIIYNGNGSAITPYPVPFRVLDASHLIVWKRANPAVEGQTYFEEYPSSLYTVTLIPETGLAQIVTDLPISGDFQIRITREIPITQETVYPVAGPFPAKSHETAIDKLTMIVQRLQDRLNDAIVLASDEEPNALRNLVQYNRAGILAFAPNEDGYLGPVIYTPEALAYFGNGLFRYAGGGSDPTSADIPDGYCSVRTNISAPAGQQVKLWANVGGDFYSVVLAPS